MGRHPDDVCVFWLDSFRFAQITSDRLGFCHTADIPVRNFGKGSAWPSSPFLGLGGECTTKAERAPSCLFARFRQLWG